MRVLDLFCGAGGFSEGFRQAGFEIILGIDNDFLACESFKLNFNCEVWQKDILEILCLPQADVIIGSPPCPHFSVANRNFKNEPDLSCVFKFFELIDRTKPKYWVMENVKELLNYQIKKQLDYRIFSANQFGLPHLRERVFFGNYPRMGAFHFNNVKDLYPTPMASDDHVHKSKNNPNTSCLSDYFSFTPEIDVFKKIMGFPYDFIFIGKKKEQIKQIGNAVCPPVAKAIAEAILKKETKP